MKWNLVFTDPKDVPQHPELSARSPLRLPPVRVQCAHLLPYGLEALWGQVSTPLWERPPVSSPRLGFSLLVAEYVTLRYLPPSDTS